MWSWRALPKFEEVFRSLTEGRTDAAVIPIENTLHGSIHENYDHLLTHRLKIVAETNVRIVHNLIAPPGVKRKDIQRVISHPVALNQCLEFFADNPDIVKTPFYDTAGSVKMIVGEQLTDAAAIASAVAAEIYGARILKRSIEDDRSQLHPLLPAQRKTQCPAPGSRGQTLEDVRGVHYRERAWIAVPLYERLRSPRPEPDEDRVAAIARQALGILVLPRLPGPGR